MREGRSRRRTRVIRWQVIGVAVALLWSLAGVARASGTFFCGSSSKATAQQVTDFSDRWSDRILGLDASFNLQQYLDATTVPAAIASEVGFAPPTNDGPTRACLTSALAGVLATKDATFGMDTRTVPPTAMPENLVDSMLETVVFHDDPQANPDTPINAPPAVPIPNPTKDALAALGLGTLHSVTVPSITVPTDLKIPTLGSKKIGDLINGLQGVGLPSLPPPRLLNGLPAVNIDLPSLPALPSLVDIINIIRSIIDSATYHVCWRSEKFPDGACSAKTPIGVPISIDAVADSSPDLLVLLAPFANPSYPSGVTFRFSVDRIVDPSHPLAPPPPVKASVMAAWDVPVTSTRAYVGFFGSRYANSTLARHQDITATLTSLSEATAGNPTIAYSVNEQSPDTSAVAVAGAAQLVRDGTATGNPTIPDLTVAYLATTPVPSTISGTIAIKNTALGGGKNGYNATMQTSSKTKAELGLEHLYTPTGSPCCGAQTFYALADQLPGKFTVDIVKDTSANKWTVGYTSNSSVDHLNLQGMDLPKVSKFQLSSTDLATAKAFSADVLGVPTKVDIAATLPKAGASPRAVDVSYAGSSATDPNAVVKVPQVELDTEDRVAGDVQRKFHAHAEQIPGRIHVVGTLSGTALDQSGGKDLHMDMTYDASSTVQNLIADYFDKGSNGTTQLHGSITTLPKWFRVTFDKAPSPSWPNDTSFGFDARDSASAPSGSASLGKVDVRYASNADYLVVDPATIKTADYGIIKQTAGPDHQTDTSDDTLAVNASYSGLASTTVHIQGDNKDKGNLNLHAAVHNVAARPVTIRVDNPSERIDAEIQDVPKTVTLDYTRKPNGTDDCGKPLDDHSVAYTASDTIDHASVRIQGKAGVDGADDPNRIVVVNAGKDPDTDVGPIPKTITVLASEGGPKVTYSSSGSIGQVAASALNTSTCNGTTSTTGLNVDVRGLPSSIVAVLDPNALVIDGPDGHPLPTPIKSVSLAYTNHPNGVVPTLPSVDQVSIGSNKVDGTTDANIKLEQITFAKLDVVKSGDKVTGVTGDVRLGNALKNVGINLDFVSKAPNVLSPNTEAQVIGTIGTLTPLIQFTLGLEEGTTSVSYNTGGDHLDANVAIGLGSPGKLDPSILPAALPIGLTIRDDPSCGPCNKQIGLFLQGAPSTFQLFVDQITAKAADDLNTPPAMSFTGYAPPVGNEAITADISLVHDTQPSNDIKAKVVVHGIPNGGGTYDLKLFPLATGSPPEETSTFATIKMFGSAAVGPVEVEIHSGPSPATDKQGKLYSGPDACIACNTNFAATISNLAPGVVFSMFHFPQSADPTRHETDVHLDMLDATGTVDLTQSIAELSVQMLRWELDGGQLRNDPQVQVDFKTLPSSMSIKLFDGVQPDVKYLPPQNCPDGKHQLPTVDYVSNGKNMNALSFNANVDFSIMRDDQINDPPHPAPVLWGGVTNLANGLHFQQNGDGKFVVASSANNAPHTSGLDLRVDNVDSQIMDIEMGGSNPNCKWQIGYPVILKANGSIKLTLQSGIHLSISDFSSATLDPGLHFSVDGDFSSLSFGVIDPHLVFSVSDVGVRVQIHISDDINPELPLVIPFGLSATLPVEFGMFNASSSAGRGRWWGLNLEVPCDVSLDGVSQFHVSMDTNPGFGSVTRNQFNLTGGGTIGMLPLVPGGSSVAGLPTVLFQGLYTLFDGGDFIWNGVTCE